MGKGQLQTVKAKEASFGAAMERQNPKGELAQSRDKKMNYLVAGSPGAGLKVKTTCSMGYKGHSAPRGATQEKAIDPWLQKPHRKMRRSR